GRAGFGRDGCARRAVLGSRRCGWVGFAPMSKTIRRRSAVAALSALLLLAACGDDDGDTLSGNVVKDGMGCSIASVDRPTDKPEVDLAAATETTEPESETT